MMNFTKCLSENTYKIDSLSSILIRDLLLVYMYEKRFRESPPNYISEEELAYLKHRFDEKVIEIAVGLDTILTYKEHFNHWNKIIDTKFNDFYFYIGGIRVKLRVTILMNMPINEIKFLN